jgi:hypothetical protein
VRNVTACRCALQQPLRIESRADQLARDGSVVLLPRIIDRSRIVECLIPQLVVARSGTDVVHILASLIRTGPRLAAAGCQPREEHRPVGRVRLGAAGAKGNEAVGPAPLDRTSSERLHVGEANLKVLAQYGPVGREEGRHGLHLLGAPGTGKRSRHNLHGTRCGTVGAIKVSFTNDIETTLRQVLGSAYSVRKVSLWTLQDRNCSTSIDRNG